MEDFKQIVYRSEDNALVVVPQNEEIETKVLFLDNLNTINKTSLLNLKSLCEQYVETDQQLKYVVAYKGTNLINIESNKVYQLDITTLNETNSTIVQNAITTCLELLNS